MRRVVIIGGGITGLSAAYTLQRQVQALGAPVDFRLIEKDNRLGGKLLTDKVDGFVLEGGPDCFVAEKQSVFELSARLGITGRLLPSNEENKGTFVLSGGRLHALPEGLMLMVPTRIAPFLRSPLMSWSGKLRMCLDLVIPPRGGEADESLSSFVTRRLGREALDKIAEPLIGGIHAGDSEQMSLKASFPRFIQLERQYGSLIRAMLAARKKRPAEPTGASPRRTYFMSFAGGMGELPTTLAEHLDPQRILLGHRVTRLTKKAPAPGPGGYVVEVEGREPIEADALIVATLANDAAGLLREVDEAASRRLGEISLASSATVSLAYRRSDITRRLEGFGFVIPRSEGRRIMAVTYSSSKWDHRVPSEEYALLRVFVGGALNQQLVTLDDADLISIVRQELEDILGLRARPLFTRIYRWVKGMSQYTLGHLERMAFIEERAARHPGLFLAGGSYRGVGVPDCINGGTRAAEAALAFLREQDGCIPGADAPTSAVPLSSGGTPRW